MNPGKILQTDDVTCDAAGIPHPGTNSVVFVRHGEPAFPEKKTYFLGKTDWELSFEGKAQARHMAEWAKGFAWRGCFCSPLKRARETATIICGKTGIMPEVRHELAEIDLGKWDGRTKAEILLKYPKMVQQRETNLKDFRYPDGESFTDLETRAVPFLSDLLKRKGRWLVVSHAGVFRVFIHNIFKLPFPLTFKYDPEYGHARVIARTGDAVFVKGFDELRTCLEEKK
ncbi:MAG: histidine phosphatase family protein [Thermovirgaceae bacterium]